MKKFCFIICCLLILPMLLVGCGKEDANLNITEDFVAIQSIEYSTITSSSYYSRTYRQSRFYIDAEIDFEVTEEEYNSSINKLDDYEYKDYISGRPYLDEYGGYETTSPTYVNKDNDNVPDINNDKLKIGTTYYYKLTYDNNDNCYTRYVSCKIKSFKVIYVQMKIISDSVIEIIDDGEHYIVQTVYYKANLFN